jgi:glycosyltransferase involved in cell wall biosynthesis
MMAETVALVTPRYPPAIGGVERHVERLAEGLADRGVGVEVITTDPTGALPPVAERNGVRVRRFPTVAGDAVYFVSPDLGVWLWRHAARYALVHAHSYHTPLAFQAALASRRGGVPFLVTPHYHGTGHSALRRLLHVPYRPVGAWMMRQARRVLCVSEAERRLVQHHFGSRLPTVVVRNGIDVDRLRTARPSEKVDGQVTLLSVGRLERYKQTGRIVSALAYLPSAYELTVIGDGPARHEIARTAIEAGVNGRVHLAGHVPEPDLLRSYRTADVFVSLSQEEAFGIAVLEAAVAGAKAVLSDIPAHREVASSLPRDRTALVAADCGPDELARVIARVGREERQMLPRSWPVPTWSDTVEGALACYRAVLDPARPGTCRVARHGAA